MGTEREFQAVYEIQNMWARRFREEAADYEEEAAAASDPYLKGFAACKLEDSRALQAAATNMKYRRRDGFKLRALP